MQSYLSTLDKQESYQTYYTDNNGVWVDSVELIVPMRTDEKAHLVYNLNDVAGVKIQVVNSSFPASILLIAMGVILSIVGLPQMIPYVLISGIIVSLFGALWAIVAKWKYFLVISSSSGSTKALFTNDANYIFDVYKAINNALIDRRLQHF